TASALAQTTPSPATLAFDVASVRPSKPGSSQHSNAPLDSGNVYTTISPDDARTAAGGYLIATHQPLWRYISFAYKLSGTQELSLRFNIFSGAPKSGAPFWATGSFDAAPEFFDIQARAPADPPVFALTAAKPGPTGPTPQPPPASDTCAPPATPNQPAPDQPAPAQ